MVMGVIVYVSVEMVENVIMLQVPALVFKDLPDLSAQQVRIYLELALTFGFAVAKLTLTFNILLTKAYLRHQRPGKICESTTQYETLLTREEF